jgi:dipeptidyl-peptidase-4
MRFRTVSFLALLLAIAPAAATEELTVDWIFSDEGDTATKMPQTKWTDGGELLLLDDSRPEAERTLERFVPSTGVRGPAVDRDAAMASLAALVGEDALPDAVEWPDDFDATGHLALYTFEDDLYLLDLAASRFVRLTATPEAEQVARFSPDGRRVAFVRANDLFVVNLETRAERRLTNDGAQTLLNGLQSWVYQEEIFGNEVAYWWSPDSAALVFLRFDESMVSEMLWVDHAPAVPRVIRQRYPKAGGANPEVRVGLVEVSSGAKTFVPAADMPYEYVMGVTWRPDGRKVAVQVTNRANTRLDLYLVDRATGGAERILSDPDEGWANQHEIDFLTDGRFVWSSERDGSTHLYLYGAGGALVRQLTRGPWSVRSHGSFYGEALGSAFVDEAAGIVYFTAREASPIEWQLYRVGLDGTGFERVSEAAGVHRVDFSTDRRFYTDSHSAHCTPPTLTLRSTDGERVAELATSRPELMADFDWVCPELLTVPAEDGYPLQVRLIKPQPFDPEKSYPAVVFIYGGPAAPVVIDAFDDSFARNAFAQLLARSGYVVMSVDPRSATGVSKTDENTILYKAWADAELADMLVGVRWLKSLDWVDGDRFGVWGWSGGGTSTLLLMTRSEEFAAGVSIAPATDWRFYDTKFTETYMRAPADNPEGYENFDLVARAGDLHGRVMLVHGTYDDNVHPQHTWAMVDALIEAGKTFDLMIYPMRKHGIDDRPARRDLFKRMLEFWKRNL